MQNVKAIPSVSGWAVLIHEHEDGEQGLFMHHKGDEFFTCSHCHEALPFDFGKGRSSVEPTHPWTHHRFFKEGV